MKILYVWLGHLCIGLSMLGLCLPLMPTVPFLILASACYARGSKRFYRMLRENRLFGEMLRNWECEGGLSARTKVVAVTIITASVSFSIWVVQPLGFRLLLTLIGIAVIFYIVSRPRSLSAESDKRSVLRYYELPEVTMPQLKRAEQGSFWDIRFLGMHPACLAVPLLVIGFAVTAIYFS